MSRIHVMESRPYDAVFDSTFTGPQNYAMASDTRVLAKMSSSNQTAGQHRYKYFRRPVVPRMNAIPPQLLLAPTLAGKDPMVPIEIAPEPLIKNAEVQTVYRDSEAQTNPYTPEFIISAAIEPEVLLLKDMSFENGLPIGSKEIDMIAAARMKNSIESNLPPFTDEASLNLRKRLMEEQEMREYQLRENELDAKREEKIAQLQRVLRERDETNEFLTSQRVEAIRQTRMDEREKALQKIRSKRIKVLRRLASQRNDSEPLLHESKKHDIIDDYFDKASELYAPTKRLGKGTAKDPALYDILTRTAPLDAMGNILDLESSIPKKLLSVAEDSDFSPVQLNQMMSKSAPSVLKEFLHTAGQVTEDRLTSAARRDLRNTKRDVEEMHLILQRKKKEMAALVKAQTARENASRSASENGWKETAASSKPSTASSTLLSKKPKGRPTTPNLTVDEQGEPVKNERALQAAIVLLQSLIRGRAIQNIMFEGKYRRRELIAELRDADEFEAAAAANVSQDKELEEIEIKKERDLNIRKSTIDAVAGGITVNLFSQLAQEQERIETITQMQAIAAAALVERTRLEAAEAGRRQRQHMKYPDPDV